MGTPLTGSSVEVRRARSRAELAAALELRRLVFCEEQGVPLRDELDGRDGDPGALHLVAVRDGRIVATCRLLLASRTIQLSRLAVARDERRRGIASALLGEADREAHAARARRIVLHAQTYARGLYEGAGYQARGPRFIEAAIEHVAMEKRLG